MDVSLKKFLSARKVFSKQQDFNLLALNGGELGGKFYLKDDEWTSFLIKYQETGFDADHSPGFVWRRKKDRYPIIFDLDIVTNVQAVSTDDEKEFVAVNPVTDDMIFDLIGKLFGCIFSYCQFKANVITTRRNSIKNCPSGPGRGYRRHV